MMYGTLFVYFVQFGDVMEKNVNKKSSAARIRANAKYNAKTYKRLTLSIRLNEFEKIQAEVQKQGVSMNSFILECIRDRIDKG